MKYATLVKQYGIPVGLGLLSIILLFLPFQSLPDEPGDFGIFLGRFHPLVVHFPIVLIILPLLFEGLRRIKKWDFVEKLMPLFTGLAVTSAAFSAIAGYLLYRSGEYSGELINSHLWAGTLLAIGANLAAIALYYKQENVLLGLLIATNLLLVYTGHLGGSLTHGSSYLTEYLPSFGETEAPIEQKPVEELKVFDDIVMAVFDAKCLSCHNAQKAKGGLVMATYEDLLAGGKSEKKMLAAGDLSQSELWKRIALPMEHEDHMPPNGKSQLSQEEEKLIEWWISSGASPEQTLGSLAEGDSVQTALTQYLPQIAHRQRVQIETIAARDKLGKKLYPLAEKLGLVVEPDPATDSLLFAISMKLPAEHVDNKSLVKLLPYSQGISKISLVSAEITDDGLYTLAQMPELRELYLSKTCIDGSGLQYLSKLSKLKILNLSDTNVDDVYVLDLLQLPALEEVYLFNSEVGLNVIQALNTYLPEVAVTHAVGDMY